MNRRRWAAVVALALCPLSVTAAHPVAAAPAVAIVGADDPQAVPGSYVVLFRDAPRVDLAGVTVTHRYPAPVNGLAGRMSRATAEKLAADPAVAAVEQDRVFRPAQWGLDSLDFPPPSSPWVPDGLYQPNFHGAGVTIYVIDVGVMVTHVDFGGAATWGADVTGETATACSPHATPLASIAAGTTYGVAEQASIVSVKAVYCSGFATTSSLLAGISWVSANAVPDAVALMSISGPYSPVLNTAVQQAITIRRIPYVVAAGNNNANACNYSPASVPEAITVGATMINDVRAAYSNHGPCVDLYAPGHAIPAAWGPPSPTGVATLNGTSFGAAHAAGVVAQILDQFPGATPALVSALLPFGCANGLGALPPPPPPSNDCILRSIW